LLFGNFTLEGLLVNAIVLLVGMTVHEFAHNYVAHRMGDPEPRRLGRLTLNPFVHINWIGWLMFVVLGFGILGSAPISPYRMPATNRRWRWLAAVAAGPLSNLLIAVVFAIVVRIIGLQNVFALPDFFTSLLFRMIELNVLLFVFNLIPLFPLDGWNVVLALLPPEPAYKWEQWRQYSYYVFIGLILLSFLRLPGIPNILGVLVSQPSGAVLRLLLGL
jgi:Zn-dependent protease